MSGELGGGSTAAAVVGGDSMSKSVVTKFFNHVLDFGDESKKEFIKGNIYLSNALGGKSGPELEESVIAKCKEAGVNIR